MPIQVIRSARGNYSVESYIADKGQIFYDEDTGDLRLSNGTPGGLRILAGEGDFQGYLNSVQGHIIPDQDNLRDLGSPEKQWRDLYLSGNSLVINGVRISAENDQLILPENTLVRNQPISNFSGDYNDLINKPNISLGLSIGSIDSQNNLGNLISDVTVLRFDSDSGFDITDIGSGAVKISMNSTFKTWKVDGQDDLIATGLDTIEFEAGTGISITTDPNASPNKKITFSGFSGSYSDLTDKPTIPTNTNQLTNGAGFITNSALSGFATQAFVTSRGYLTSVSYGIITDKPDLSVVATTGSYADLINLPILFSGDYDDLTNRPAIPSDTGDLTNSAGFITASALSEYATETYVDQAISDVVGAAPEVLDTLKELSDALGNDADFASNISTSLSSKANTADLDPVAFSGDYTDLSNKPSIPRDLSELTDNQSLLASEYTFNIAADDSTQRTISNNETVKILGTNGITTGSDDEGNITVSGPNLSTVATSGDYDDLTNKPAIPSDIGDLTDTNNLLFSGDYDDLTNTPTVVENLSDLKDVDVATNPPQLGQVLKYDGQKWGPAADIGSADPGSGGAITDASTLNGFSGSYYLNYNNLNNKPAPYELPPATTETLGGVRVGENITVTNGTISVPKGAGINKVVDIPDVYDDNGLENKYILRYNSGATRWETEDLDLSNSTMDGGFY